MKTRKSGKTDEMKTYLKLKPDKRRHYKIFPNLFSWTPPPKKKFLIEK